MRRTTPRDEETSFAYVGRNVRAFRERKGLTQAELGQQLQSKRLRKGVSRQTISKYEKGENIDLGTLADIAKILEIEVDELLARPGRTRVAAELEERLTTSGRSADFFRALADMVDQFDRKGLKGD